MNDAVSRVNAHALIGVIAAAFCLYLIASLVSWHVEHFYPSLWLDMVHDAMAAARLDTFDYLFATHNEHIIATSRPFFIVDRWFGATGLVPVIASYTMQLAVALALGIFVWRGLAASGRWQALLAVALVAALTLNGSQILVLSWGLMVQHVLMNVVIVSAALLTCRMLLGQGEQGVSGAEIALWCVTLFGLFTLGNGAAVPLAGLVLALLCRASKRLLLHFVVQCVVVIAVYLVLRSGSEVGLGGITRALDWPMLPQHLKFVLATVGGPLLRATAWPSADPVWPHAYNLAIALGAGIALLSVVQAYRVFAGKSGAREPVGLVGLYLLVIAFGTALAASLSRIWLLGPLEALSQKYAVFTCMAWVGAVLVLCQWLLLAQSQWRRGVFAAVTVLVLISVHSAQQREMRIFAEWSRNVWESNLALLLHIDDRAFLNTLYQHPEELGAFTEQHLQPAQEGIFHLVDVRYGQQFDIVPRELADCSGVLEVLVAVPPEDRVNAFKAPGTPYRFWGYASIPGVAAGLLEVLALGPSGRLVGYARPSRPAPDIFDATGGAADKRFFGFLRVAETTAVDLVARAPGGASCRIGSWQVRAV